MGFGDAHCDRDLARREEVKEEEKKEEENQTPLIKSDDPHLTWQVGGKRQQKKEKKKELHVCTKHHLAKGSLETCWNFATLLAIGFQYIDRQQELSENLKTLT